VQGRPSADRGVVDGVRRFGILSTFPPTACGIATFSAALAAGLVADGATVDVVRCGADEEIEDPLVVASMGGGRDGVRAAADALNQVDVAIVQHEYGIYGGADGQDVLDLLDALVVPSVVVAHTVVRRPTPHQRLVLERVCDAADAVVVMTDFARQRLIADFDVDADRVFVIPHGATTPPVDAGAAPAVVRPPGAGLRLLTWGLLGPGKGIEWAVDAMGLLDDVRPRPSYLIAGATHPNVRRDDGEAYREMLVRRSRRSAAADVVSFDDSYRDLPALTRLISTADLVVLPYDSDDQVTSGVLVDAVAFGCPVVATAFPHAIELLGGGAGIVVPQRDAAALAGAVRGLVAEPQRLAAMAAECRRLAPELSWPAVARRYDELASSLLLAAEVGT
jgi:glycosyltransferase involved in cell wall biosynthesis